ncbi:MAG: hypothetical protein EHM87_20225 [Burkholderiales bacterium]|nr:MAG: hypothetical protein EHM87_20225 [Burkholderiales bacterium]
MGPLHVRIAALLLALAATGAHAQPAPPADDGWVLSLEGAVQGIAQSNPFWGLAQTYAPTAGYDTRIGWIEAYVRPGARGERRLDAATSVYGGVSMVASGTLGSDVFQQGDTGRLGIDDAFLGLRHALAGGTRLDLSAGAQRYVLGQGLVLAVGAGNGFERGAATLAPRRAWGMSAIARASHGPATLEAFWLDPNELPSGDTGTRLAGGRAEWSAGGSTAIGVAWFQVLRSTAPYPQAPLSLIESGRDGLRTTDAYLRWAPDSGPLAGLSVAGELALQRNDRIAMKAVGYGAEVAYVLAGLPLRPRLSWSPRYFSGDDPGTSGRLERFDALFYDGAPQTWSSGGNGSFAFYNSNVRVDRFRVDLSVSARDFVSVNYWNVRAAQANSPLQYGQGARITPTGSGFALVTGVPTRPLSQELYVEWTRVLSPRIFLTAGVGVAKPDDGIKAVVPTGAKTWTGGLLNLAYRY